MLSIDGMMSTCSHMTHAVVVDGSVPIDVAEPIATAARCGAPSIMM
jgi:hypothetical protein